MNAGGGCWRRKQHDDLQPLRHVAVGHACRQHQALTYDPRKSAWPRPSGCCALAEQSGLAPPDGGMNRRRAVDRATNDRGRTRAAIATFDRMKSDPKLGRGVASGDAGLSCAQKCISGILGPIRTDRRRCFPLNGINCASQGCDLGWSRPMVAQPAEELPSTRALQQAVDPKRERRPRNKPRLKSTNLASTAFPTIRSPDRTRKAILPAGFW